MTPSDETLKTPQCQMGVTLKRFLIAQIYCIIACVALINRDKHM